MEVSKQLNERYRKLIQLLIKEQNKDGFWTGRLSSSALSTAVAIVALKMNGSPDHRNKIEEGLYWLLGHHNLDGGFGDTPQSISNVSTSLLGYAAIYFCSRRLEAEKKALNSLEEYLLTQKISLHPDTITSSVLRFYGKDYTFSVPILSMLVICGVLDEKTCRKIPQLPFELVLLPSSWYSFFNMRVVSYALPALIAMGIFIFKKRTRHNPVMRLIRKRSVQPSLSKLTKIVPESGGFLEATPLTGFVSMCLISSGYKDKVVVQKGISFLVGQQRADGSWPIDTDLSTWVSSLSIKALGPDMKNYFKEDQVKKLQDHFLSIQYREKHPFNQALPGGWGWTNYSGSVPDVDDTCGAILALLNIYNGTEEETAAILRGCEWLLAQQNRDGGFPTFCRGWGRLPFDSSCSDLTGHAFAALMNTIELLYIQLSPAQRKAFYSSAVKGLEYLKKEQKKDGSWLPLWFGNQETQDKTNPVYGTAKVSVYLSDCLEFNRVAFRQKNQIKECLRQAHLFLLTNQNEDGSWGGAQNTPGSIEETSLAICALGKGHQIPSLAGFQWLEDKLVQEGITSAPIGLYFAALWYDEKLYPLIYYIEALRRFLQK